MKALLSYDEIKRSYERLGYKFFSSGRYNLNIFGIRNPSTVPNRFDDHIGIAYLDPNGAKICKMWDATTDPGTYWLEHPMYPRGTAIVKPGQYIGSHRLGMHHGEYEALVQCGNITFLLDADRNNVLDFSSLKEETRNDTGINIHHASDWAKSIQVDKWSAACQVFADPHDFADFIRMVKASKEIYGNLFSYTLFTENQIAA